MRVGGFSHSIAIWGVGGWGVGGWGVGGGGWGGGGWGGGGSKKGGFWGVQKPPPGGYPPLSKTNQSWRIKQIRTTSVDLYLKKPPFLTPPGGPPFFGGFWPKSPFLGFLTQNPQILENGYAMRKPTHTHMTNSWVSDLAVQAKKQIIKMH